MVLHVSVWSWCVDEMDTAELSVPARPGVGDVQQWMGSSAVTAHFCQLAGHIPVACPPWRY